MDLEKERELVRRFEEEELPRLLHEGYFSVGENPKIAKIHFESTERNTDHFASWPYFVDLTVESDEGRTVLNLIVKFCVQDDSAVSLMHVDRQFSNEIKMYNEIFPKFVELLRKNSKAPQDLVDDLIAKCFYGHLDEKEPKNSYLVFTNLKKLGYRASESKIDLDFEHCAMALRKLGQLHALSLSLKIRYPEILEKMKTAFIECRYFDDPVIHEHCEVFHTKCNQRAIDYLLSLDNPGLPKEYLLKFQQRISCPYKLMTGLLKPKEPTALICHGDFCRNNMFFLYENDRVVDVKFFDFQTSRYSSPAIDIAFFLYLNTTQNLRNEHFDELFNIYHSSLISTTSSILDLPEEDILDQFPMKLFLEDFAQHAIYAYSLVAFFKPVMAEPFECNFEDSAEKRAQQVCDLGGEEVSKIIADVILDFYNRKFYDS